MKILCRYKLTNSDLVQSIALKPSDYFNPISDKENFEDDAIPKFDDSRNYLPEIKEPKFEWDEIIITESLRSDKIIRTEYFSDGKSQLTVRKDKDGYELILQSVLISATQIFISRMERDGLSDTWKNTSFRLGVNFEDGENEKWFNLKKGELNNN